MESTETDAATELVCVMASLGYSDDDQYYKGVDCLESLKDLIRFLRREDDGCSIRRQMGYAKVLQNDLLPILIHHGDDEELVDIVIRLMVNLTSPAEVCFERKIKEAESGKTNIKVGNSYNAQYMEVVSYLQGYKEAFTSMKAFSAIGGQLGRLMQMDWEDRSEDHLLLLERILLLIRNIVHIPASPEDEQRTDDDVSIHDRILWSMHVNGIDDLLLYISSSPDESQWAMHAIETISLMLREQSAEKLASAGLERSEVEKQQDTTSLLMAREEDKAARARIQKKINASRHSRFGGSYWVANMKGVDSKNTLVHHKPVQDVNSICFDEKKFRHRKPKNRQVAKDAKRERTSTLAMRLFLKEFCVKFLENCYNPLMRIIKDNVTARKTQENDETYYIWAMRFFMAFNRAHEFKAEYVRETLHMNTFHYVLKQLNLYYDQFLMHKRSGWEPWQKRLHLALQAYKELLTYVSRLSSSKDELLKEGAAIIQSNIFYHEEYRHVILLLLRHFTEIRQPWTYLVDIVETVHLFLKLLENFCKKKGSIIIKKRKVVKRKRKTQPKTPSEVTALTSEQLEELWENQLAPSLSSVLQGVDPVPENLSCPFDAASDIPEVEQRMAALVGIQTHLRNGRAAEAVGLLRMAREIWPEEHLLGSSVASPEEEFGVVRSILTAELERPASMANEESHDGFEEQELEMEEEEEEEEEDETRFQTVEREFSLEALTKTLASPFLIQPYCFLLQRYRTNTTLTNHAIIKMLHRVAIDLKCPEMLYQLSLFITFKEILSEPNVGKYQEMATFAKYVVSKFVSLAERNPHVFVELLFWKNCADCTQINPDQPRGTSSAAAISARREKWTLEDEEELRSLYDQFKDSEDVVSDILQNISNKSRTRRQVTNKLVRLRIVENVNALPKPRREKIPKWTSENTEELHRLFEEFKESDDPLGNIMRALSVEKSKNAIAKQLLLTGKISDRKELRKKRRRKSKRSTLDDDVERGESRSPEASDEESDEACLERDLSDDDTDDERVPEVQDSSSASRTSAEDDSDEVEMQCSTSDLVIDLVQRGSQDQVSWIQSRLRRVADDREADDDWYDVPLLTMTEDDDRAMGNKLFLRLLKTVGCKPPADEQETFWRIPATLSPAALKEFAHRLSKPVEGASDQLRDSADHVALAVPEEAAAPLQRPVKKKSRNRELLLMLRESDDDDGSGSPGRMEIDLNPQDASVSEELLPQFRNATETNRLDDASEDSDDASDIGIPPQGQDTSKASRLDKNRNAYTMNAKRKRVIHDKDADDDEVRNDQQEETPNKKRSDGPMRSDSDFGQSNVTELDGALKPVICSNGTEFSPMVPETKLAQKASKRRIASNFLDSDSE